MILYTTYNKARLNDYNVYAAAAGGTAAAPCGRAPQPVARMADASELWPAALLAKAAAAALALPLPADAAVRIGRNGALDGPQLAESMRGGGGDVSVASLGAFPSLGHEALDELALELGAVSRVAQLLGCAHEGELRLCRAEVLAARASFTDATARRQGKIHRVDPDFGSTLTVSKRDSQSKYWVSWKIMGQPCEFQVRGRWGHSDAAKYIFLYGKPRMEHYVASE